MTTTQQSPEVHDHDTIYDSPRYRGLDVGRIMRQGHPDIAEGDEYIASLVVDLRERLGRELRIVDVGSGSGDLSLLLAQRLPDCEVIANEIAPNPVAQARGKLAAYPRASVDDRPFEKWDGGTVDVVISWGTHHHLAHDYLDLVRRILAPDGVLIVGDEFCPEYLTPDDQARLASASAISIVDGYIFDDPGDIEEYRRTGTPPAWSERLEQARRKTLWTWYKFVCDYAVAHDAWPVVIAELAIARDDLVTEFDGEHKTSPYLLRRELELNGFAIVDDKLIGNRRPALRSFSIYTCRVEQPRDRA